MSTEQRITTVHDYNGTGKWSAQEIVNRYLHYCSELGIQSSEKIRPGETVQGHVKWIYPVMDEIIEGIRAGDAACAAIGIEFIEEDQSFSFGMSLKSATARALRRATFSRPQILRLRRRFAEMLVRGYVPQEFKEYARLFRKIGLGGWWPYIQANIPPDKPCAVQWYEYFQEHIRNGTISISDD